MQSISVVPGKSPLALVTQRGRYFPRKLTRKRNENCPPRNEGRSVDFVCLFACFVCLTAAVSVHVQAYAQSALLHTCVCVFPVSDKRYRHRIGISNDDAAADADAQFVSPSNYKKKPCITTTTTTAELEEGIILTHTAARGVWRDNGADCRWWPRPGAV